MGPDSNAFILDNQYLSTLLESGAIGVLGVAVLLLVPAVRLALFSRWPAERIGGVAPDERRDLAAAVAVSISGYVVALFFFDGFSFIQTLLTFFLLLAAGSWALAGERLPRWAERRARRVREREVEPV